MKEIGIQEFVRRVKASMNDQDCRFAFFLGSGCSVSSGVPAAAALVKNWLPRLKKVKTGDDSNLSEWTKKEFPDYNGHNAAQFYGKVIEELFFTPEERQKEIERLTEGKDPGFGYAVLAHMMSHESCGRHCNIVLTTNFDDMVADALYLYTNKKPLVISHESLVNFVRISRTRPLALKLHGDARLAPLNTEMETEKLGEAVKKVLYNLLSETGLIFFGYGGNDNSIADILNGLPKKALPWGIYWVNTDIPDNKMGEWLRSRSAIWVKHTDFDEAMLLFLKEFNLQEPDWKRFDVLSKTYYETFTSLSGKIDAKPDSEEKDVLEEAIQKVISESKSWWSIELEARKYKNTDKEKADLIYAEGLKKFHDNANLTGNYAVFLKDIRKDYDKAEELYKRALELDPNHANLNSSYARFLSDIRKDYDKAEELFKRALELDPNNANTNGNYALFLFAIRKDYDKAEELYKRALELDPNHANLNSSYARFLSDIRKDYDKAEELFKRGLELDPNAANNTGNYAGCLLSRGKKEGFELLKKALNLAGDEKSLILECRFYEYAHIEDSIEREKSLAEIKKLINSGVRSPGWNLEDNVNRATQDAHPQPDLLKVLAKVVAAELDVMELDKFTVWKK